MLLRVDSVQLFHDRARAVRPGFRVTKHNASAIEKLCARLEGLPLSIELCAARAGAFSPSQMLARLQHRFDFLTEPPSGSSYRHPTLRAALEWSYALLWPELQAFFACLCVFRGGCTPQAAAFIAQQPHAAHLLHQLRLVSLARSAEVGGETRFYLLETVREFAREKLSSALETDLRRRHAEFFAALIQSAEPHLGGPQQGQWIDRLEIEADNGRAALDWSADHALALHLRMVGVLGRFWLVHGYYAEGRNRIQTAMQLLGTTSLESEDEANAMFSLHLQLLGAAADLSWYDGDFAEAFSLSERKLGLARQSQDARSMAEALHSLGFATAQMGDFTSARPLFEQSLTLSRQALDDGLLCEVLLDAAGEASGAGDFARARILGDEGVKLARLLGNTRLTACMLNIVGFAACLEGDLKRARPLLEESLALLQSVGEKWHTNRAWWTLGHLARLEGDFTPARAHFTRALQELRDWGCLWPLPYHLEPRAYMDIAEGRYQRAAQLLGAAQTLRENIRHALHPALRPEYEGYVSLLHENFDAALLEAAWNAGRALNWEKATSLALEESI
jgi:Flp pilus assembly protein TadD